MPKKPNKQYVATRHAFPDQLFGPNDRVRALRAKAEFIKNRIDLSTICTADDLVRAFALAHQMAVDEKEILEEVARPS